MAQYAFQLFPKQQLQAFGELTSVVFYDACDKDAAFADNVVLVLSRVGEWQRYPVQSTELQLFECPSTVIFRRAQFAQSHTAMYAVWLLSAALGFHPRRRWTLADAVVVATCVDRLNGSFDTTWHPRDFSVWHQRHRLPRWMLPVLHEHDVSLVLEQHELQDDCCNLFLDCKTSNLKTYIKEEWQRVATPVRAVSRAELRLNAKCASPAFVPFSPIQQNCIVAYTTPLVCNENERFVSYKLKNKLGKLQITKTFTTDTINHLYDTTSTPSPSTPRLSKSAPDALYLQG